MSQETAGLARLLREEAVRNGVQMNSAALTRETQLLDFPPAPSAHAQKLVRVSACNGSYKSTAEVNETTHLVHEGHHHHHQQMAPPVDATVATPLRPDLSDRAVVEYNNAQCILEWRDVSLVMDRVFFIIYIILIVVSLITLFPRPGR